MLISDKYELIFWDFDGVIKESVSVKTDAFVDLFRPYGRDVCEQVRQHHLANGGMSRYQKIPTYLKWAGLEPNDTNVRNFCDKFSNIVKVKVIASAWVPGVEEVLHNDKRRSKYVTVSATPQGELEEICKALKLDKVFHKIFGSPLSKTDAIRKCLLEYDASASMCLMIGDSVADIEAAQNSGINFIFRKHEDNLGIQINENICTFDNFLECE